MAGKEWDDDIDNGLDYFFTKDYNYPFQKSLILNIENKYSDMLINSEFGFVRIIRKKIVNELGGDNLGDSSCLILEKNKNGKFKLTVSKSK